MARYKGKIETTGQALRDFAETLRLLATEFERHADFMNESNLDTVWVTHWPTAKDAAEGLARFAGAAQAATMQARMDADLDKMTPEDSAKPIRKPSAKKKSP